jgi:hypothetical protein
MNGKTQEQGFSPTGLGIVSAVFSPVKDCLPV